MFTNTRPRILQVVHSMDIAGTEKVVYSIVKNLNRDFYFSLYCLDSIGRLGESLLKEKFDLFFSCRKPGIDFSLVKQMSKIIKQKNIDIVHAHQYTPYFYSGLAIMLNRRRPKLIFTEHGRHQPDKVRFKRVIFNQILNYFTDKITGVSRFSKESLIKYEWLPATKISVIYNGIDLKEFDIEIDKEIKRRELGIGPRDFVIGTVARFSPVKNHKILLLSFSQLIKEEPHCKLVLVGEGPLKEECRRMCHILNIYDSVLFLGERNDIAQILKVFDIFVLPSIAEANSFALLEAMASGLPVIATRSGGNTEIIRDGKNGILVEPNNFRDLYSILSNLIRDRNKREILAKEARKTVEGLFTLERMIREYKQLYFEIINDQR